jgi:hypothetical protein
MCVDVTADGSAIKNFTIVDRVAEEHELRLMGYTEDEIHLSVQSSTFMTSKLFNEWAEELVITMAPGLLQLPRAGLSEFLRKCREAKVYVVFLLSHTLDQTQSLD